MLHKFLKKIAVYDRYIIQIKIFNKLYLMLQTIRYILGLATFFIMGFFKDSIVARSLKLPGNYIVKQL